MVLSERILNLSESATIKMAQMARSLKAQGVDIISLSLGEPDFDTDDSIKEAAIQALRDGKTKYTPVPGLPELRDAIVDKFKRDNNLEYSRDQIVVSCGAKQSIANAILCIINPGDEVIIFSPYWVSYFEIIRLAGGVPVPVYADVSQDYKIGPEQLKAAITDNTKAIIFSSPCNPTGSVFSRSELADLVEVVSPYERIHFISDEIYEYINFKGNHVSIASFEEVYERTITINGFSKGFAMTGWRLGYMAASLEIAQACEKIQGQFTSGANSFSQVAAAYALVHKIDAPQKMRDEFLTRRDMMLSLMDEIPEFKSHIPDGAFYVFPDISALFGKSYKGKTINNSNDLAMYLLNEAHVATVGGEAFGAPNCLRISYAASEESLKTAMKRIYVAVKQLH